MPTDLRSFIAALTLSGAFLLAEVGIGMTGIEAPELGSALLFVAGVMLVVGIWLGFSLPIPQFPRKPSRIELPTSSSYPSAARKRLFRIVSGSCVFYVLMIAGEWFPQIQIVGGSIILLLMFLGLVAGVIVAVKNFRYWLRRRRRDPYH